MTKLIKEEWEGKGVSDLSEKHFSRYGEFLVSFELSKYGWNVYEPVYDEYIDFIIHKYICKNCNKLWNHTPQLVCKQCAKDFTKSNKNRIIAKKICSDCKEESIGNIKACPKCKSKNLINRPTCDKCNGEVEMKKHICECGSTDFDAKFRTIQVKSSRIEDKNTYAVDMKPKDLIEDGLHYFIWCLIDKGSRPSFLVMSVTEFKEVMQGSLDGISFFKDQDRQHFNSKDFGKWGKFQDSFDKLE